MLQNQSPQVRHADLILNLMRCIGASATAEDNKEEDNQNSPAMLKKQRRYLLDPSGEDDKDLQAQTSIDKSAASGNNMAAHKKGDMDADMDWPIDAELFGVAEIAEMAILLLQMILELCGRSLTTTCLANCLRLASNELRHFWVLFLRLVVTQVSKELCLSRLCRLGQLVMACLGPLQCGFTVAESCFDVTQFCSVAVQQLISENCSL